MEAHLNKLFQEAVALEKATKVHKELRTYFAV